MYPPEGTRTLVSRKISHVSVSISCIAQLASRARVDAAMSAVTTSLPSSGRLPSLALRSRVSRGPSSLAPDCQVPAQPGASLPDLRAPSLAETFAIARQVKVLLDQAEKRLAGLG